METRKVGIVTINDDTNYGNRLQNYALKEALRSLGWEPETLRNRPPAWGRDLLVPRLAHDISKDPVGFAGRAHARVRGRPAPGAGPPARYLALRRSAIAEFARSRMNLSPYAFSERPARYWSERYDCAVVGSDQVWNPVYRRAQGIDFLDFMEGSRRIAYAASFGTEEIPRFLRSRYRGWLAGIHHLSVREEDGRRIVAELIGRRASVVADPTMLVDRAVWDRLIAEQAPVVPEQYAVRFFLGHPAPEQDAWVARDAERGGLAVVDLHALDEERFAGVDPAGFIAAIARAAVVYTDSFHAGIFTLLHRRPLVVRTRFERDPRWRELLSQHGLSLEPTGVAGLSTIGEVDWAEVETRRNRLRAASMEFLRHALDASGG